METINSLLNLPEHATATERACAVYELLHETDNIQAARATAESLLSALRESTSHIFAESICAARGITDASAQEDIRAAWCADPYAALNAFAGDNITAANPYGCNQYGHEWRGKHGEGWRGGKQPEDTFETLGKRKLEKKGKSQDLADKIVKLVKKSELEKDKNKIKEINLKIKKLSEEKKKLDNEIQEISMKEVELRDRERYKLNNPQEKKSGPPKDKNGAFKIPGLKKAIAVPTSAPGEKQAPIFKPSYMTDEQFKDALDGMDKDGKKSLSDALKKIAPRMDKNGQGLMPFAKKKK